MDKSSDVLSNNSIWLSQHKSKTIGKEIRDGEKIFLLLSSDSPALENVAQKKKKKRKTYKSIIAIFRNTGLPTGKSKATQEKVKLTKLIKDYFRL